MPRGPEPRKHTVYYELIDAAAEGGCPVCTMALMSVRRYLQAVVYEGVNDPPTRDTVVAGRGYCNEHSWLLQDVGAGLGAALIYRDILRHFCEEIEQRKPGARLSLFQNSVRGGMRDRLGALVRRGDDAPAANERRGDPHTGCPACAERERYETLYLDALVAHINDEAMVEALRRAGGLCFVHLDLLGTRPAPAESVSRLLEIEREILIGVQSELSEFIRKNDYRYAREPMGSERDSWLRAIGIAAGKAGIR